MTKKHVIIIHGGSCWKSYAEYIKDLKTSKFDVDTSPQIGWQKHLQSCLGAEFKVLRLEMPNWHNAKYLEWKIWFEKAVDNSGDELMVIGHSLGAIIDAGSIRKTIRIDLDAFYALNKGTKPSLKRQL